LADYGFPAPVIQALQDLPEPTPAEQERWEPRLAKQPGYVHAVELDAEFLADLKTLYALYRWRADWLLWCDIAAAERAIIRDQPRIENAELTMWEELRACPFAVLTGLPPYDVSDRFCRSVSGILTPRLSVANKVTLVICPREVIETYPVHREYRTAIELGLYQ